MPGGFGVLVALAVLLLLVREFGVSASKAVIGDLGVDLFVVQLLVVGFVGKTGIGGDDGTL